MVNVNKLKLALAIIFILFGIFVTFMAIFDFSILVDILCVLIGLGIIIANVFPMVTYAALMNRDSKYSLPFVSSLIGVILGVSFIFFHNLVLHILVCVFLIGLPIIRIAMSDNKKARLKKEAVLIILGILVIFNAFDIIGRVLMVLVGLGIIAIGVLMTISDIIVIKRKKAPGYIDASFTEVEPEVAGELEDKGEA